MSPLPCARYMARPRPRHAGGRSRLHVLGHGLDWFGAARRRPAPFIANLRLIQALAVACVLWSLLVFKRVIAPDTGKGLVLASFGVHCRLSTDVILYGMDWPTAPAWGRPFTDFSFPAAEQLRHLHSLLHYGGLFAYVIGFALVLHGARTDARRRSLSSSGKRPRTDTKVDVLWQAPR